MTSMLRVILGLVKGGIVGAGLGYGAFVIGLGAGASGYLVSALVGFFTGVVCGRPLWRQETLWTPVVKGLVGAGVCSLLLLGLRKLLGGFTVPLPAALEVPEGPVSQIPLLFGTLLGIVYGILVEVDDGGGAASPKKTAAAVEKVKPKGG